MGIEDSPAAHRLSLANLIQQTYGRPATTAELDGYEKALESGATQEQVVATILATPEFYARAVASLAATFGTPDQRYLGLLYEALLQRLPSSIELNAWALLMRGLSRQEVVHVLLSSREYRNREVRNFYTSYLHRSNPPSDAEITFWVSSKLSLATVSDDIQGSYEYYVVSSQS
jgi:hypothetical protein